MCRYIWGVGGAPGEARRGGGATRASAGKFAWRSIDYTMSVDRNGPCRCGSGKKYKKCHLGPDEAEHVNASRARSRTPPPESVRIALAKFAVFQREREKQKRLFGHGRPIITWDGHGHRFVAVGGKLLYAESGKWRTFHDFLVDYIGEVIVPVLGAAWVDEELAKPLDRRHTLMRWFDALRELKEQSPGPRADGIHVQQLDGPSAAYLILAYDLYLLAHHKPLHDDLIRRLKGDFQSVRYEIAIAATMIRAGCELAFEDESDNTRTHPEYVATHKTTGIAFAVEDKSRKRPGVMDWKGPRDPLDNFTVRIDDLLRDAIRKSTPDRPFVICIDGNMPPEKASLQETEWVAEIDASIARCAHEYDDAGVRVGTPYSVLFVTNFPHDYGERGQPDPPPVALTHLPPKPQVPLDGRVLHDLQVALNQYGNIPAEFPAEWGRADAPTSAD
jgi:hypothetical protein